MSLPAWTKGAKMVIGAAGTLAALLLASANLALIGEPYWIAQRYWVRGEVKVFQVDATQKYKMLLGRLSSLETSAKEKERLDLEINLDRITVELQKLPPNTSESLKTTLRQQAARYRAALQRINAELRALNRRTQ